MAIENFAPNTLIIPMDTTYQDSGMWLAYGLVYRLLSNNIPVKWAILPGKAWNGVDFTATTVDVQSGTAIGSFGYRGGPFIIDSAFYAQALPIVQAWQAANPTTKVHRATAPFSAPIASTMNRKPIIAVEETNSGIVTGYLNAAKIPDSNGNPWPNTSPDILSADEIGAGAYFSTPPADPCRQLKYDIFLSPHTSDGTWTDPVNAAALDNFVKIGGMIHAMCHSMSAIENFAGPFLTTSGFTSFGNKGDTGTFTVDVPDFPTTQAVNTAPGKPQVLPGGSEQTWLHTSVTYLPSTQVLAHFLDNSTQYDFMVAGSYKGGTGAGKVEYEGGHQYATTLPYSNNAEGPYLRFFYDSIFFAITKPTVRLTTIPKNIPAGITTNNVQFIISNTGGSPANGASASVTLAPWACYNAGSASIPPTTVTGGPCGETITWNAAALAGSTGPGVIVTFTANVTPPGTGFQSVADYLVSYGDDFDETYTLDYCASLQAQPGPLPVITKLPLNQSVSPNGPIAWTITVANNGTANLNNIVVTDTLPAGLTFVSAVPAPSSVVGGGVNPTVITWQSPQIPATLLPGTNFVITLNATAPGATTATFINDVIVTGTNGGGTTQFSGEATAAVQVNNRPPTATLISPNGGELICQNTTIQWTAQDPDGDPLTYTLQYSSDGGATFTTIVTGLTGSCPPPGPPYCSFFWDTTALPSGNNYIVKVIASDGELTGEDVSNAPFTIDNTPPTVSWVSPLNGATLSTTPFTLQASATDNVGVTNVEFLYSTDGGITFTSIGIDGTAGPGNIYDTTWELTGLPQGTYLLRAIATDQCGKTTSADITVTVNLPPEVTLISPNGGEVICPQGTTITWTADDPNGDPLTFKLEYSANGGVTYNLIADGLTGSCPPPGPPYCSFVWDTSALPSGNNYLVRVTASDGLTTATDVSNAPFTIDNTPPTVNWVSPTNGATITTSPVTLEASAIDNVGVTGVTFEYSTDGGITYTLIGTDNIPSGNIYSVSWNFGALPGGTYNLRATATDGCNQSNQAIITVTADLPPTVNLIAPNGGEIVCQPGTTITWTASDPNGDPLSYSLLYSSDGGTTYNVIVTGLTGSCPPPGPPFCSFVWNTVALPSGDNYKIKVVATDGILTAEDVSNAAFTIDNTPPSLVLVNPITGDFLSNTVTLTATATDNVGVTGVTFEYSQDGGTTFFPIATVIVPVDSTYAFSWDTTAVPNGPTIIRATAKDQCNNTTVDEANVTIDNTPPTVAIPSPPDGSTVEGTVPIVVTGADNECLARIDLYIDGQLVHTETFTNATTGDFIFDWDTTAYSEGPHIVKAVATDCAGLTAETQNTYIVDNIPDHFAQVLVDGNLVIPPQKPDVEMILDFVVEPDFDSLDIDIFNTIDGTKVTVQGFVEIQVTYAANTPNQSEHFAHFRIKFHAMILFPGLPLNAKVEAVIINEHQQYHLLDPRTIKKDIVLLVGIKEKVC